MQVENTIPNPTDRYFTPWFPVGFHEGSHIVTYERYVEGVGFQHKQEPIPDETYPLLQKQKVTAYKYYENDITGRYGKVNFDGRQAFDQYGNPISDEEAKLRCSFINEMKNMNFNSLPSKIIFKYKKLFEELKKKEMR